MKLIKGLFLLFNCIVTVNSSFCMNRPKKSSNESMKKAYGAVSLFENINTQAAIKDSMAKCLLKDFLKALRTLDCDKVEQLLNNGFNPNTRFKNGIALHYLAALKFDNKSPESVKQLIMADILEKKGSNIEARTEKMHFTVLHVAAAHGNLNMVEFLIDRGANMLAQTKDRKTANMLAKQYDHKGVLSYLDKCIKRMFTYNFYLDNKN